MITIIIVIVAIGWLFIISILLGKMRVRSARRAGILPPEGGATMADVARLIQSGHAIWAIRCYREVHKDCSLAEAKKAVEELAGRSGR